MRGPCLNVTWIDSWLRTEHWVRLPLAVHPCLWVDACGDGRRCSIKGDRCVPVGRGHPSVSHGGDVGSSIGEMGRKVGAGPHDMGHVELGLESDMIGGR